MPKRPTPKKFRNRASKKTRQGFSATDDKLLVAAYNECVNEYQRLWSAVSQSFKEKLQANREKRRLPKFSPETLRRLTTQKRLRERYLNHLQPGVRSDYDKTSRSKDVQRLEKCLNAAVAAGAANDHAYSEISKQWKAISPSDFLGENTVKNFLICLRSQKRLLHDGETYKILSQPMASKAELLTAHTASPAPSLAATASSSNLSEREPARAAAMPSAAATNPVLAQPPTLPISLAYDEAETVDFDHATSIEINGIEQAMLDSLMQEAAPETSSLQRELDRIKAKLSRAEVQLEQYRAALKARTVALQTMQVQTQQREAALTQRESKLEANRATFRTAVESLQARLRSTAQQLITKEQSLNEREHHLARREAALATAPKTDESRADSAAPSGLQWTF